MLKTYKSFVSEINEALRPSQYRSAVKGWDKTRLEKIFKQSPLEKDRNAYRLYIPLEFHPKRKTNVQPHRSVEKALTNLGYSIVDYSKGIASKNGREERIGQILKNDREALRIFSNDPARSHAQKQYMAVISRHPYDIAGMSTDRNWMSCQSLGNIGQCDYVPQEGEEGVLIAYMIDSEDMDIKKPLGRVLLIPYINKKGQTAFGVAKNSYGKVTSEFIKKVEQFSAWLNKQRGVSGIFQIQRQDDGDHKLVLIDDSTPEKEQLAAIKIDPSAIKNLTRPSERVQLAAIKGDLRSIKYINNPTEKVQLTAITDVFNIANINNPTEKVQIIAVKSNGYSIKYINNPSERVQLAAVSAMGSSIRDIANPSEKVQLAAIENDPDAIDYIKNPSEKVVMAYERKKNSLLSKVRRFLDY